MADLASPWHPTVFGVFHLFIRYFFLFVLFFFVFIVCFPLFFSPFGVDPAQCDFGLGGQNVVLFPAKAYSALSGSFEDG